MVNQLANGLVGQITTNYKQDGELSFFVFSFNDLSYTLNATRYTLERNCPEVFP